MTTGRFKGWKLVSSDPVMYSNGEYDIMQAGPREWHRIVHHAKPDGGTLKGIHRTVFAAMRASR